MLDETPSPNRLARLFALHRLEAEAREEPEPTRRRETALSDAQIASWQAAAAASLRD